MPDAPMEAVQAVNALDYPRGTLAAPTPPVTRQRYVELVNLAKETVEWLESKGLKKGEQCEFRALAERLWWAQ